MAGFIVRTQGPNNSTCWRDKNRMRNQCIDAVAKKNVCLCVEQMKSVSLEMYHLDVCVNKTSLSLWREQNSAVDPLTRRWILPVHRRTRATTFVFSLYFVKVLDQRIRGGKTLPQQRGKIRSRGKISSQQKISSQ